jgi:hypothetical protein
MRVPSRSPSCHDTDQDGGVVVVVAAAAAVAIGRPIIYALRHLSLPTTHTLPLISHLGRTSSIRVKERERKRKRKSKDIYI